MKIFITGASGYIGGSVAHSLRGLGYEVRGLTRTVASAQKLKAIGIEPVVGSLDDTLLLEREARAADGIINTASSDHAAAVRALITGAQGSGKPLLHTSGSSVIGDDARGTASSVLFDDDTPLVVHPAKQDRRDIDLEVLNAAQRDVRACVICPALIYGLGRGLHRESVQLPFLAANAREHGVVQIVGAGLNRWSNVHIDDVVALYQLALTKASAGAFYFAENGEASFGDMAAAMAQRLRLAGVESLPAELAAQRWGEPRAYFSLGSNSRVRAMRARRELSWTPRHASVLDWISFELPTDVPPISRS